MSEGSDLLPFGRLERQPVEKALGLGGSKLSTKINRKLLNPLVNNNQGTDFFMSYTQSGKGFFKS